MAELGEIEGDSVSSTHHNQMWMDGELSHKMFCYRDSCAEVVEPLLFHTVGIGWIMDNKYMVRCLFYIPPPIMFKLGD